MKVFKLLDDSYVVYRTDKNFAETHRLRDGEIPVDYQKFIRIFMLLILVTL